MEVTERTTKHWVYGQGTKGRSETNKIPGCNIMQMRGIYFPEVFNHFINPFARRFLQDGDHGSRNP